MGRRNTRGRRDRKEAAMDRAKGRLREAAGALSGDGNKKARGRADQRRARFKEKRGNLRDLFR